MSQGIVGKWSELGPELRSLLRIVAAAMFILAGTSKLFAFPVGMPPNGGTAAFGTQVWIGGVLEVVGGALLLVGLFTRPVAFVLSGEMAVAYFMAHAPLGPWPILNKGELAVLYAFLFLHVAARGAGAYSLDALLSRGHRFPFRLRTRAT